MTAPPPLPQVYQPSKRSASASWPYFAGGAALLLFAGVAFVVALRTRTSTIQLHLTTTLPTIMAVGLLSTGFRLARSPRQILVDERGVHIRSRGADTLLSWDDIAWAEVQTQAVSNRPLLIVYGNDGKALLKLPAGVAGFDAAAARLKQRLADHPSPRADALRWSKSRRTALIMFPVSALALAGAVWTASMAYTGRRDARLMKDQGVDGKAVVLRKFIAPDGRTRRIEYRVVDGGDTPLKNVEVQPRVWATLREGMRVPVRTVPGRPDISKLSAGEVEDDFLNSPGTNALLSAALFLLSGFFITASVLAFKGIDISTDPITGKLRVTRLQRPTPRAGA